MQTKSDLHQSTLQIMSSARKAFNDTTNQSPVYTMYQRGWVYDNNLRTNHQPRLHVLIQTWPISRRVPIIALKDFKISRGESPTRYHDSFWKNRTNLSVDCFNGRRWTPDCQYFVTVKRHQYKNRIYKHGFRSRQFWHLTNSLIPERLLYINIHPKRFYRKSIIEVKMDGSPNRGLRKEL